MRIFRHEKERIIEAIYVFDRTNTQITYEQGLDVPEPPNIRLWLRFSEIFLSSCDVDREGFFTDVFKPHTNTK